MCFSYNPKLNRETMIELCTLHTVSSDDLANYSLNSHKKEIDSGYQGGRLI